MARTKLLDPLQAVRVQARIERLIGERFGGQPVRLAEALQVSRASVSQWRSGRVQPEFTTIAAMATIAGMEFDEFVNGTKELDDLCMERRFLRQLPIWESSTEFARQAIDAVTNCENMSLHDWMGMLSGLNRASSDAAFLGAVRRHLREIQRTDPVLHQAVMSTSREPA